MAATLFLFAKVPGFTSRPGDCPIEIFGVFSLTLQTILNLGMSRVMTASQ
jgi:hypothetical protein